MVHFIHYVHPGTNVFHESSEKRDLLWVRKKSMIFMFPSQFPREMRRSVREKFISWYQVRLVPGISSNEIRCIWMGDIKAQRVKRMCHRLKEICQIIIPHKVKVMVCLSILLYRTLRLDGRVYLESSHIQRGDQTRVVSKCHFRSGGPSNDVWRCHSLSVNEIETNPTSTDAIRLATIETSSHGFVAFQMSLTTSEATCAYPSSFGIWHI